MKIDDDFLRHEEQWLVYDEFVSTTIYTNMKGNPATFAEVMPFKLFTQVIHSSYSFNLFIQVIHSLLILFLIIKNDLYN